MGRTNGIVRLISFLKALLIISILLITMNKGISLTVASEVGSSAPMLGKGTSGDPYLITTAEHLNQVRNNLSAYYRLEADIDLCEYGINYDGGRGWLPIGNLTSPFTGQLDGNGHVISNLYINRANSTYIGLLGKVGNSTVKGAVYDLGIVNADVRGQQQTGILIGSNGGQVARCYTTGKVSGGAYIGGLIGHNGHMVLNSYSTATIVGVPITSTFYGLGGLIGNSNKGTVLNCYFAGKVINNGIDNSKALIGISSGDSLSNNYYDTETVGIGISDEKARAKTTHEMKQRSTFGGFEFSTVWTIDNDVSYPYLVKQRSKQDLARPTFITGYPNCTDITDKGFRVSLKTDEASTSNYVILERNLPLNANQVKAGTDDKNNNLSDEFKGSISLTAQTEVTIPIEGLKPESEYFLYIVAEDLSGNLQISPTIRQIITLPKVPSNIATLSNLKVNDVDINGFDSGIYNYTIEIPFGTQPGDNIARITATATDVLAKVQIITPQAFPGIATVEVTAEDGISKLLYSLNFVIPEPNNNESTEPSKPSDPTEPDPTEPNPSEPNEPTEPSIPTETEETNEPTKEQVDSRNSGSSEPEENPLSRVASTTDDRALEKSLSFSGQAVIAVEDFKSVELSAGVLAELDKGNLPFTLEYPGIKLQFNPGTLNLVELTGSHEDLTIIIGAEKISSMANGQIQKDILSSISTEFSNVGIGIFDLNVHVKAINTNSGEIITRISEFLKPVAVTINLSQLGQLTVEQLTKLSGVRLEMDSDGKINLVKLGGTYDSQTKSLTFYTDKFSFYSVMLVKGYPKPIERLAGYDRYQTAVTISKRDWQKSESVILANGDQFSDLMAGGTLAYLKQAPILLTGGESLNEDTRKEIERLGVKKVVVLGGPAVISEGIEKELRTSYEVERIWGIDRYETAIKIGEKLQLDTKTDTAIIVAGTDYSDALNIGPFAAKNRIPILYTETRGLTNTTQKALYNWNIKKVILIGGFKVISKDVEKKLKDLNIVTNSITGFDKFSTSLEVVRYYNNEKDFTNIILATGEDFPDALVGVPFAARQSAPVLLVSKNEITVKLLDYLEHPSLNNVYVLGGSSAISKEVLGKYNLNE